MQSFGLWINCISGSVDSQLIAVISVAAVAVVGGGSGLSCYSI